MTPKKKTFDAIAMKREAQQRIYAELPGLSPAEEHAYWERANRQFQERLEKLREQRQAPEAPGS